MSKTSTPAWASTKVLPPRFTLTTAILQRRSLRAVQRFSVLPFKGRMALGKANKHINQALAIAA